MSNIFTYFNRFSQQHEAIKLFNALSFENKASTISLTVLSTIITLPFLGIGGMATFRALTDRLIVIDPDSNSTTQKIAELVNKRRIKASITSWANDPSVKGNKQEACRRICEALENDSDNLDLSQLGLSSLPESIGELKKLKHFNADYNKIKTLPHSISKLTGLVTLQLYEKSNRNLPDSIGELTNLTILFLFRNQLKDIPNSIGSLTKLQKLDLSKNILTRLPDSIGSLTKLQELALSGNKLTRLPDSICKLTELIELNLADN